MTKKQLLREIRKVYGEFGLDVHSIPSTIQGALNEIIRELIKARSKNTVLQRRTKND